MWKQKKEHLTTWPEKEIHTEKFYCEKIRCD
jgi:hypothetical protein